MKIFAETERLILREMLPTDVEEMYQLDADPEVHKYLGNKSVTSREQTVDVINFSASVGVPKLNAAVWSPDRHSAKTFSIPSK